MSSEHHVDVAVVGAGLAGLSAARDLVAQGMSVVVLEARDRVGGRVLTREVGDGLCLDMGAQWTGPGQERLLALAKWAGVEMAPVDRDGADASIFRHADSGTGQSAREIGSAVSELDAMASTVPADAPWDAPNADAWDALTVQSWLDSHVTDARAQSILRALFIGFMSAPSEVSLLHALFYAAANGGMASLLGDHDDAWFVGGAQQIAVAQAADLGDRVILSEPVRAVCEERDAVRVVAARTSVTAQRVVVAMPPAVASRMTFDPPLSSLRDGLMLRAHMGPGTKAQLLYETPFWRSQGLSGRALIQTDVDVTTLDSSPPDGPGVLTAFATDPRIDHADADVRQAAIMRALETGFGPQALAPIVYIEQDWGADPYARGCVMALPPGAWTVFGRALRQPCGRVHWAGTETAIEFPGQMEGAVRSGERAAAEIRETLL